MKIPNHYYLLAAVAVGVFWWLKSSDLNPFDSNGSLGLIPKPPSEDAPRVMGYDKSHDEAMRKIGLDIKNYSLWYPLNFDLSKMPKGTISVKWGNKKQFITYYAPKLSAPVYSL